MIVPITLFTRYINSLECRASRYVCNSPCFSRTQTLCEANGPTDLCSGPVTALGVIDALGYTHGAQCGVPIRMLVFSQTRLCCPTCCARARAFSQPGFNGGGQRTGVKWSRRRRRPAHYFTTVPEHNSMYFLLRLLTTCA